jgi:hypothetical protein
MGHRGALRSYQHSMIVGGMGGWVLGKVNVGRVVQDMGDHGVYLGTGRMNSLVWMEETDERGRGVRRL